MILSKTIITVQPKIKPKSLRKGDHIGIVSPSYWLDKEVLARAKTYLEEQGYRVTFGSSVTSRQAIFAGSPEARAEDIMSMFSNASIDAIICARGGYGANRVLPLLDYDLIRNNPKIFMGFSDITAILTSLVQNSGLVCFHGPMLSNFGRQQNNYNLEQMEKVLSGTQACVIESLAECQSYALKHGEAEGELCGGNLSLIVERLATPGQINTHNKILLIEEVGEKLYAFDRMMMQLKNSGTLEKINGLIIGEMTEMGDTDIPFGQSIDEIVLAICDDYDIPIISNFPAGHGKYITTLPFGHPMRLVANSDNAFLQLSDSPVLQ